MNRFRTFLILAVSAVMLTSAAGPYEAYVEKYAAIAVDEMYRSGVPASITLAQGLLESGAGLSRLSTQGNNHFGIKCHNKWKGKTIYADDDRPNECFRAYSSAADSFRDHSDFLRYSDRYKFLFDFEITDYKSWAYGLKKAGYATDKNYPAKLIEMVEDYGLSKYDRMTPDEVDEKSPSVGTNDRNTNAKKEKKARKGKKGQEEVRPTIPESPLKIEAAKPVSASIMEEYRFALSRQMYSRNGVPFIYSVEGETYASIASANGLFVGEILKYNDLQYETALKPGTVVYLQPKKKQSAKGLDKYIVGSDGESLRGISQRFGVRLSSILKRNSLKAGYVPREGDELLLRKKR